MKNYQTIVKKYAEQIKKAGIPISAIYVFGSQVKGTSKKWSDIDVCIISPLFGENRHSERVRLMNLQDDSAIDIEPHPYSPQDFAVSYDPLASEIKRTGIQIPL